MDAVPAVVEPVVVVGTVLHLGARVVAVPSRPAEPTRLPRTEELRRAFLAANPDWVPDDNGSADEARRGRVLEDLRTGAPSVVELHGPDLPGDSVRARVHGTLTGRSLQVERWRPEPDATSVWAEPRVGGTDPRTAEAILEALPEHWPLVSLGVSTTTAGRHAVMVEVLHLDPEIRTWFDDQPPGAVQLETFVDAVPGAAAAVPAT